jgi:mono/diheme cytochrome c family protein
MSREPVPPEPFGDPPQADEIDLSKTHGSILREHKEPVEGRESVPLWLVGIIMALVFWGGFYLAYYSGGFRAESFNPRRGMTASAVDGDDPAMLGKRVFMQNCVLCHQATGLGVPRVYPPLAGSEWVMGRDWRGDNHLVAIVLQGLQGPVQVDGSTFNNAMPGWSHLRDGEIAAVLTYIRSEWGNSAPAITEEFVKRSRAIAPARTVPWSPGELRAIARELSPAPVPSPAPAAAEKVSFPQKAAR